MIKIEDRIIIDRIKELRQKNNLSQSKFAELIGVSSGNVGQWERYITLPGATALKSIALKFECSADWILLGVDNTRKDSSTDYSLNTDDYELLKIYSKLDYEGKVIVKASCYHERRRMMADKENSSLETITK